MKKLVKFILTITSVFLIGCREKTTTLYNTDSLKILLPDGFPQQNFTAFTDIYSDQYSFGQGLKTGNYEIMGTAIDINKSKIDTSKGGGSTLVHYEYAEDYTALKRTMGLNISLNAKIGWFSASSSLNQLESLVQNSLSSFLVAKVSVTNPTIKLDQPHLTDLAQSSIKNNPEKFYTNYGDYFISGKVTGGELYIVYEFLASSIAEKNQNSLDIKASVGNLVQSVSAVVNYTRSQEANINKKSVKVTILRLGDKSNLPNGDLNDMLTCINTFPEKVTIGSGNAAFIKYICSKYTATDFGTEASADISSAQNTLDALAEKQRRVYQLLSWKHEEILESIKSIDFALNKSVFNLTSAQTQVLSERRHFLRAQNDSIDICFTTCANLGACQDCLNIVSDTVFKPDFNQYQDIKSFIFIEDKEINNSEINISLLPNSKYKLTFSGRVLGFGNKSFEPFVSAFNDGNAVPVRIFNPYPPASSAEPRSYDLIGYPVIVFRIDDGKEQAVQSDQRSIVVNTDAKSVIIHSTMARYYIPRTKTVFYWPQPSTPDGAYPRVQIFQLQ